MALEKITIKKGALYKKRDKYIAKELIGEPAIKQDNKDNLTVTVNTVEYDADTISINYMSSVTALANFKMLQALYNIAKKITNPEDDQFIGIDNVLYSHYITVISLYEAIFKTTVGWKNTNNMVSQVQIESIAEALELAMGEVANIVGA